MSDSSYERRWQRTQWFRDARFGMFLHWGLYAIPARGEWVRSKERLSIEDYQSYFNSFDPDCYDPREWARLARASGMKYAVLTAKHHDGFCLFDSELTDYKSTNTPCGRDLVAEYVEAFRAEGLSVGLYYSLIDWHHRHYPVAGHDMHPMRDDPGYRSRSCDWAQYVKYLHGQVRELMTNYGKIDIAWFDFSCGEYTREKWEATELVQMIRALQPDILLDNRLGGDMRSEQPESYAGDFDGPEQIVPREPIVDVAGRPLPWEVCMTLNNSWGYNATDTALKDASHVIRVLVNCVSKGGNLLVNLGPTARGEIPAGSQAVLREVGQWLAHNSESIYGAGPANHPKPEWGRFTQNGRTLYAHVMDPIIGHLCLPDLKGRVAGARVLADGAEAILTPFWNAGVHTYDGENDIFLNFGRPVQHTFALPDSADTVVALALVDPVGR